MFGGRPRFLLSASASPFWKWRLCDGVVVITSAKSIDGNDVITTGAFVQSEGFVSAFDNPVRPVAGTLVGSEGNYGVQKHNWPFGEMLGLGRFSFRGEMVELVLRQER